MEQRITQNQKFVLLKESIEEYMPEGVYYEIYRFAETARYVKTLNGYRVDAYAIVGYIYNGVEYYKVFTLDSGISDSSTIYDDAIAYVVSNFLI